MRAESSTRSHVSFSIYPTLDFLIPILSEPVPTSLHILHASWQRMQHDSLLAMHAVQTYDGIPDKQFDHHTKGILSMANMKQEVVSQS